ncbi:THUMP-like domain-containing protein [Engelhardtia mirabilis]|uniref:THUMP-like domain-containing protein n=1 Tax=Engelhardtia mirabilis TaxID=2528011 RepID=UPI00119F6F13
MASTGEGEPQQLQLSRHLRRLGNPALALEAQGLFELRRRARRKLAGSDRIFLSAKGLEQSSSLAVAAWRAARVNALTAPHMPLVDLTCGIGSDAAALAAGGRPVLALDRDPETVLLASLNLERLVGPGALAVRADASRPPLRSEVLLMLDADRRPEGRRELDPERWAPAWSAVLATIARAPGACIKLAPAVEVDTLDATLPSDLPRRWSWVGLGRELVEVVLWTGQLAPSDAPPFEALVLERDGTLRGEVAGDAWARNLATPLTAAEVEACAFIVEPHAAVVRSGLIGALCPQLGVSPLGPRLAFLGGREPVPHPLARRWRVLASCAADRRRVRAMLREADVGPIEVFTRGHPTPPEKLAKSLRGPGHCPGVVLIARLAEGHRAFLVEEA